VSRSTLSKRVRGVQQSGSEYYDSTRLLNPTQEHVLIGHINHLTEVGLPPTPAMVRNFARDIGGKEPGRSWISRFVERHSKELLRGYLRPLDSARHKADSEWQYQLYFDLLAKKIDEYEVFPSNIYNMDEKGFLIGFLTKSKRIYSETYFESRKLLGHIQDGNREWITILGCICADGIAIPPLIIFQALTGNLQDSWLQDLDTKSDTAYFASSPTGWTNDDLGFEWLTKVFDRETKSKARNGRD
jgi:hypothetical protein